MPKENKKKKVGRNETSLFDMDTSIGDGSDDSLEKLKDSVYDTNKSIDKMVESMNDLSSFIKSPKLGDLITKGLGKLFTSRESKQIEALERLARSYDKQSDTLKKELDTTNKSYKDRISKRDDTLKSYKNRVANASGNMSGMSNVIRAITKGGYSISDGRLMYNGKIAKGFGKKLKGTYNGNASALVDYLYKRGSLKGIESEDDIKLAGENNVAQVKNIKNKISGIEAKKGQIAKQTKGIQAMAGLKMSAVAAGIAAVGEIAKKAKDTFFKAFDVMGLDLKNLFSDVISNVKNELSSSGIASYSTGTTLFTNSTARNNQMKYGLSSSSNYAMMQTMGILGMSSDEDLMYMNSNQRQLFSTMMNYYKTRYNQLMNSGALIKLQKAQIDFKIFKQELAYKFLNWFAEHKDQIMKCITNIFKIIEALAPVVLKIVGWLASIASWLGGLFGSKSSTYLESTTGSSINLNYTQNNTISGTNGNIQSVLDNNSQLSTKMLGSALSGSN